MSKEQMILNTDDQAASLQTVTGWVSRSGRFYGIDERLARWDGCTHVCCRNCDKPVEKNRTLCSECRLACEIDRYNALPKQEWDRETPLYSDAVGKYFFGEQDLLDHLYDENVTAESLRLVICTPNYASQIDPDYWHDDLPEEGDLPDEMAEALEALNEVIRKQPPVSWSPGKFAAVVTEPAKAQGGV